MQANADQTRPRLFLLGLDGATFRLLEPWMARGDLPHLRQIMESGVHGPLESTYPPLTAPAWASFMTGKLPGNHGLFEFFRRDRNSYELQLNSRHDIDGRTLWRILSDAGRKVGVIGVPLTWPPEQVNGFIVTGLLTPRQSDVVFTHPAELGEELHAALGGYRLQHTEKYLQDDPSRLIREEFAILDNKVDAALHLLRTREWDFFMLHILGTDVLQHAFWHWMDPEHPQYAPERAQEFGDVILDYYRRLDQRLPELLALVPEDSYLAVMSDHGFGPLRKYINFNTWLLQEGFLHIKRTLWSQLRYLAFRLGYNYRLAWEVGSRIGVVRWVIRLGRGTQDHLQRRLFLSLADVDWSRTKAYSVGNFGQIHVNLKGREPQGCVEPGEEYETVVRELQAALGELKDPDAEQPVVGPVWLGREIWQGQYADQAPDLFFFTKDYQYKAMGLSDFGSNQVFEELYGTHAHHHMDGVFMLRGPGVRRGARIEDARLVDLAANILHLLGVPVPQGLDSRILSQAFTGDLAERPVVYERADDAEGGPDGTVYTPEEEQALTEMLRDLGYVS